MIKSKTRQNFSKHGQNAAKQRQLVASKSQKYEDIERLKTAVLLKKHQWRKSRNKHYLFYIFLLTLISFGIFAITDGSLKLSILASQATFISTLLLTIAFLLLAMHEFHQNSFDHLEELVENEVIKFRHEANLRQR